MRPQHILNFIWVRAEIQRGRNSSHCTANNSLFSTSSRSVMPPPPTASYIVNKRGRFAEFKATGHEVDHLALTNVDVKNSFI
jgi:hypothetical protein